MNSLARFGERLASRRCLAEGVASILQLEIETLSDNNFGSRHICSTQAVTTTSQVDLWNLEQSPEATGVRSFWNSNPAQLLVKHKLPCRSQTFTAAQLHRVLRLKEVQGRLLEVQEDCSSRQEAI